MSIVNEYLKTTFSKNITPECYIINYRIYQIYPQLSLLTDSKISTIKWFKF